MNNRILLNKIVTVVFAAVLLLFLPAQGFANQEDNSVLPSIEGLINQALDETEEKFLAPMIDTLEIKEMPIEEVLDVLADKTGFDIFSEDDLQGNVTAYFKQIQIDDALRIILDQHNFAYLQEEDVITVMTASAFEQKMGVSFNAGIKVATAKLHHAETADIIKSLFPLKSQEGKIISYDAAAVQSFTDAPQGLLQTLILLDSPRRIQEMLQVIETLDVELQTQVFQLRHKKIDDLRPQIEVLLTYNLGYLEADPLLNTVTVVDTPKKLKVISQRIKELDKGNGTIRLETKILQITLNDEHLSGVDWEAIVSNYQSLEFQGIQDDEIIIRDDLSLGTVSNEDYDVLLEALDTVGIIHRLSDIKTTMADRSQVEVTVHPKRMFSEIIMESERDIFEEETTNIRFFLTPTIKEENVIALTVSSEIISPDENLKASTVIRVEDGATVVIGSLFEDMMVESMWKIPLLGDLPLLGFAFRNQGQHIRKTEVILFLTPKRVLKP